MEIKGCKHELNFEVGAVKSAPELTMNPVSMNRPIKRIQNLNGFWKNGTSGWWRL